MPVIRRENVESKSGGGYPAPFDNDLGKYELWPLSDAGGLTQFGAGLEVLHPGASSSLRHWHENEDEFLYLLDGELMLIDDDGEHVLRPGDAATFKAGDANGHHFRNLTDRPATYLIVGTRATDDKCHYSDVDMLLTKTKNGQRFTHGDGSPLQSK